jgi:hypothetical protein
MTKKELIEDEFGSWDNIKTISFDGITATIHFGGGSPFSDE